MSTELAREERARGDAPLQEQFVSLDQQEEAVTLGLWLFLATEVLFFGGLLLLYSEYRSWYPIEFGAASRHLDIVLGTLNTAILLTSSFLMAGAVTAARLREQRTTVVLLVATAALGLAFLAIKGYEWHDAAQQGFWPGTHWFAAGDQPHGERLFFALYYTMTGLHGVHLLIGVTLICGFAFRLRRLKPFRPDQNAIALLGLYWHFVDIVWIFLYPLLYLVHRAHV